MKCPVDGKTLRAERYKNDILVDFCRSCGGIWLDGGELNAIQETIEQDYSDDLKKLPDYVIEAFQTARQMRPEPLNCPKCSNPMDKREYAYCSQIIIDICPNCSGIWLDKGELQALEIFFEKSTQATHKFRRVFLASFKNIICQISNQK